ncbi:MAG: hypothetical protein GXP54_00525 [Deltaproteobacteria bacterium]|nr:hypothetical protein [Deltaproteobacteria bacterium]
MVGIPAAVRKVLAGLLAAGFLLTSWSAYEHLVLVPHRYCAVHHAVEPIDDHDQRAPAPDNGHQHCRWDFLLNLSLDLPHAASLAPLTAPMTQLCVRRSTPVPSSPLSITLVAPKTSPPAVA